MERRLAAVMIADVVGYGRLSQIDEEGTRARFQADLKEIFEPKIAAYRGRLIKTMGDGLLVEFPSVVDALRCAVEAQQVKAKRNAAAVREHRIDFRIGVNLGDVIVEGEDIHGDGVNIADRIQALAEPGGVAISGTAYDHVKAKLPVGYVSLGEQKVKSIAEPVRVYRVAMDPIAAGKTVGAHRGLSSWRIPAAAAAVVAFLLVGVGAWWQPWKATPPSNVAAADTRPSLVVLPFDNLSSDAEQGYLADGITEDLTTELARIPGLFVISRNAAFAYKGKEVQAAQIADELGVRYILEGSVRRAGDDMRINAQLIDGQTAGHLWAERFVGSWKDVLTLQDDVIKKVAVALQLQLVSDQAGERTREPLAEIPGGTRNPAAYDAYLRGLEHEHRGTAEDWAEAAKLYQQAVALDPDFGRAWAKLAGVYSSNYGSAEIEKALDTSNFEMIVKARQYLEQAEKRPSGTYFSVLADLLLFAEGNSDKAIEAAERGIELDPSDPDLYEQLSHALSFNGRAADAGNYIDMAMRVDPGWTPYRHYLAGLAHFCQNRFEDAVAALTKVEAPETTWLGSARLYLLTAAEAHLNDVEAAATYHQELDALKQAVDGIPVTGLSARTNYPFKVAADTDRLIEGLRRAGVPDVPFGYDWNSTDRLYGEEIRSLLFGHQTLGILVETGDAYTRTTSASGAVNVTNGPWSDHGFSQIEADAICTWVTTRGRYCSTIFRNPGGTFEKKNEYVWINHFNHFEFSIVK